MAIEENKPHSMHEAALPYTAAPQFPALRNPRYPVSRMADVLEPYLRAIVEKVHPEKIILFGSQAYGQPTEHSDVDLLVIRRHISSEKQSNLDIREAIWDVSAPPISFTFLSKTPQRVQEKLQEHSPVFEEIFSRGVELYAA